LDRALKLLEDQERSTISTYLLLSTDDIGSALEKALTAAKDKQKVCKGQSWTITIGNRSFKLRDKADKTILWLDKFKGAMDVASNADPIHVGIPWAGIRLLLEAYKATTSVNYPFILLTAIQATISERRQMSALLSGLETAFYMTNRLKVYWAYLHGLPEGQSRVNFGTVLTSLHSLVLQFLARAIQVYKRDVLSRSFNAFWNPDEISGFESDFEKIAARAEIEASNCCRTLSTVEQERAICLEANLQTALKELEEIRAIKESVNMLANKIDEAELPSAGGAAFNSYDGELGARCHPDTRTDLLRQIENWAEDPQGKCIFWLNGMAGTGKLTISRTVAQRFADAGQLGASFFFKRGEVERGNASRLFPTIATQLQNSVPSIIPFLTEAIKDNRGIAKRMLKEQFEHLIFNPLQEVGQTSPYPLKLVIVVDVLDECERDGDIGTILHLTSPISNSAPEVSSSSCFLNKQT